MNNEIKKKWAEALRSNEYRQGQNCLRNERNEFCCLGVLTDLYAKETEQDWRYDVDERRYSIFGEHLVLPEEVREWADLDDFNPDVELEDWECDTGLAALNDNGYSFNRLADIIEEQL